MMQKIYHLITKDKLMYKVNHFVDCMKIAKRGVKRMEQTSRFSCVGLVTKIL